MSSLTLNSNRKLTFIGERKLHILWLNEILYCRASENYCKIHLENGSGIMISLSIAKVENRIDSKRFFRIHRSYLVNLSFVREFNYVDDELILKDGTVLPVARRRKQELMEWLNLDF